MPKKSRKQRRLSKKNVKRVCEELDDIDVDKLLKDVTSHVDFLPHNLLYRANGVVGAHEDHNWCCFKVTGLHCCSGLREDVRPVLERKGKVHTITTCLVYIHEPVHCLWN